MSAVSNGTSTAYNYNAASEQVSQNGTPETYDAAGNLLSASGFSSSYNTLEQPSTINGNADSFLGVGENLQIGQGSSTLINSALGVSAVITGAASDFISRDSSGMPLGGNAGSGDEYFIDDPVTGSVISVLNSNGQTIRTNAYDPYGGLSTTGTGTDDIGWDGNTNAQAGIYHFGARQYSTSTDRWTQPDPDALSLISDPTQADPFVFAGDDPINTADTAGTVRGTAGGYADNTEEGDAGSGDLGPGAGAEGTAPGGDGGNGGSSAHPEPEPKQGGLSAVGRAALNRVRALGYRIDPRTVQIVQEVTNALEPTGRPAAYEIARAVLEIIKILRRG